MLQPTTDASRFVLYDSVGQALFEVRAHVAPETPWRIETRPVPGGLDEVVICLEGPVPPDGLEQVSLELSPTPVGQPCLAAEARVLVLGGFEVTGRGAVSLGTLLGDSAGQAQMAGLGIVLQGAGCSLLLGAGFPNADFGALQTDGSQLTLVFSPRRQLSLNEEFHFLLGGGACAQDLLHAYGEALGRHARPLREIPKGWNSWDYYQGAVTMDDLRTEMAAINASALRGCLKYLVIDMGWENCWGDWRPNRKFPDTPAAIATEIKAAGFMPGIWLAPLQASTHLPELRHERDCFCRGADGEPLIMEGHGPCLLFDPTHPHTVQWLRETCLALREAGFELFKVDYLYRNYFDAMTTLHDPTVGKAAAARRFLEIIRDAIGPEAHLLSCGAPMPCALGIADSARISTDIHNFWGHVRNSAMQIATSQWLNGRAWVNDPDFALIRCRETSADPYLNPPYNHRPYTDPRDFWMAGEDASFAELQTWLSLVHLCGGSLFASDSLARLNDQGKAALARLYEQPAPAPAVPLDLLEAMPPRLWLATAGEQSTLGVFNWEDEPTEIALPGNTPATGVDYWTGEQIRLGATVRLPGRSALLVRC